MGWENRPYYRESSGSSMPAPLHFLLFGSVPLFTAFGIRVRAHASLLALIVLFLIFGFTKNDTWDFRFECVGILAGIILLHEFGHCFAARSVGGDADEILLTPVGGLAFTMAPRRPMASFITVAGGPAVNFIICTACLVAMGALGFRQSLNPWMPMWWPTGRMSYSPGELIAAYHLNLVFAVSYLLLLFNLLPIYFLDGGQMLHAILWHSIGWHQAMLWTCMIGMIGSVPLFALGLITIASGGFLLACIMACCFGTCYVQRRQLVAAGASEFETDDIDYSQSLREPKSRRRKQMSRRKVAKLRRQAQREEAEAGRIDSILAKVSHHGMNSLTYHERRILKKATERQKRREMEMKGR